LSAASVAKSARAISQDHQRVVSFFDFQRIDWTAAKKRWTAESASTDIERNQPEAAHDAFADALKDLDPRVFPRHLHMTASASWKDARGMHFDGWIE
jgi:hypothetical protein